MLTNYHIVNACVHHFIAPQFGCNQGFSPPLTAWVIKEQLDFFLILTVMHLAGEFHE